MKGPTQLFGTTIIDGKEVQVMACRDIDNPNEILFHLWGDDNGPRAIRCKIRIDDSGQTHGEPINYYKSVPGGGLHAPRLTDEEISELHSLDIAMVLEADSCIGTWSGASSRGEFSLQKFQKGERVRATTLDTWEDFKQWASNSRSRYDLELFRGHDDNRFPLCTTFHRTGRQNLIKYCDFTLPEFRSHAEASLGIRLHEDPRDFATLLALAQHHGLPTPLLDFTTSPYIAAFFAFTDAIEHERSGATHVRIFGIASGPLAEATPPVVTLTKGVPFACTPNKASFWSQTYQTLRYL